MRIALTHRTIQVGNTQFHAGCTEQPVIAELFDRLGSVFLRRPPDLYLLHNSFRPRHRVLVTVNDVIDFISAKQ